MGVRVSCDVMEGSLTNSIDPSPLIRHRPTIHRRSEPKSSTPGEL